MNIGENVKRLRQKHGLLQKQVAAAIGVHASNYNRIEKGERQFTIDMLVRAAKLFDVSIEQIIYPDHIQEEQMLAQYDKSLLDKVRSIDELDQEDQKALFVVLDGLQAKKRLKSLLKPDNKK